MSQEEIARRIAIAAHEGQVDKAGRPYELHPRYVADHVTSDDAKAVAWLHDVLEDTDETPAGLLAAGVSPRVVRAVQAMTRRAGEDYISYVRRVSTDEIARVVKLADLAHNTDLSRLPVVRRADLARTHTYARARRILIDVAREAGDDGVASCSTGRLRHLGTVTMETERLRLRRLREGDAAGLYAACGGDAEEGRYLAWNPCASMRATEDFVRMHVDAYESDPSVYAWAITLPRERADEAIGMVRAFNVSDGVLACELGCMVGRHWWGHGIAGEAVSAVVDFLMGGAWFNRVQATTHVQNVAATHVLRRCGFLHEGALRQATHGLDGRLADLAVYAILQTDWIGLTDAERARLAAHAGRGTSED